MIPIDPTYQISTLEDLSRLYERPSERALRKQIDRLDGHCRAYIAASPFLVLGTCGPDGADASPRGDHPGFVRVLDDRTLLIPDRRGNNRIDSLRNIIANPVVALLFLVPGVNETLRVNGRAAISAQPSLIERFAVEGRTPRTVLVVTVEQAFMQCARALVRSELWKPARQVNRSDLPSLGTVLAAHTGGMVDAVTYDAEADANVAKTLY